MPGRDGRREVDDTETLERPAGPLHPVEELEVVQERVFGIDRQRVDLAAAGRRGDLALLVRQRRAVEKLRDALPALDFGEQHAAPPGGQRDGQGAGDGRLAGAALSGDDMQAHIPEGMRLGALHDQDATRA